MNTIEFTTVAHDGVIDLPAQYLRQWNQKRIRVICLDTEVSESTESTGGNPIPTLPRKAGALKGRIKIAPDFNAPLDDFAEYEQ